MKIFEKEIKTQLMVCVIDDWLCNMSDGNVTAVCSFDKTKCFDTITHSILLKKMEY